MKFFIKLMLLALTATSLYASDITIENSRVRLMPPSSPISAGYFSISNNTSKDIILTKVSSDRFESIEMHNTIKDGDIMKMVKQNSVIVPAKSKLEFKPMSYHLMLIKPNKVVLEGDEIDLTFILKSGKSIPAVFKVKKMNTGSAHGKHGDAMKYMTRPDFVFPAGVKGGKNMMSKKIMFGYKFGAMEMKSLKNGTNSINHSSIQSLGYSITPIKMSADMHMFSIAYAVNEKFSVMSMLPYIEKKMEMKMLTGGMAGNIHSVNSRGIGDLSIAGLFRLSNKSNFKIALSIPTAEYNEKDHNMSGALKTLPYPLQLGSGTYDLTLGYSFQEIFDDWSYGIQLNALTRFDYNSEGWKYGDSREVSVWLAKPLSKSFSVSFGLDVEHQENIGGKSASRNNMIPTWGENNFSHLRVSSNIGINYKLPKSKSRIGIQCGAPIYRDVNGPQMEPDFKCKLGFLTMI